MFEEQRLASPRSAEHFFRIYTKDVKLVLASSHFLKPHSLKSVLPGNRKVPGFTRFPMTMKASFTAKIKTAKCVMNPHAPNVGLICLEIRATFRKIIVLGF